MKPECGCRGTIVLTGIVVALLTVLACLNAHLLVKPMEDFRQNKINFSEFTEEVRTTYTSKFFGKNCFINLNGFFARLTGRRVYNKVILMNNGMLTGPREWCDVEPLAENLAEFKKYLSDRGIPFLYVQAPCKPDMNNLLLPENVENYANQNADELLKILQNTDICTLDLRPFISASQEMVEAYFYRTDHHWNSTGAFVAFQKISQQLQDMTPGNNIDTTYAEFDLWEAHVLKNWFLGSYGKRVGVLYDGVDDIIYYTPKFETSMSCAVPKHRQFYKGNFSDANIRSGHIKEKNYFGDNPYCLYIGGDYPLVQHRNVIAPNPFKVLIIKDSFTLPVQAYFSTLFQEVDVIDPRHFTQCTIVDYVNIFNPDFVIVMLNPSVFSEPSYSDFDVEEAVKEQREIVEERVVIEQCDIEIMAKDAQFNYIVLASELEYGKRYTLQFDNIDFLTGSSSSVASLLYDPIRKVAVDCGIFDVEYCRKYGGFTWTFNMPKEGSNSLQLLLYSGLPGATSGIASVYSGLTLTVEERLHQEG